MKEPKSHSLLKKLSSLVGLVLFGAAIWVIAQEVGRVGWDALVQDIQSIHWSKLTLVLILTIVAYVFLTTYDVLAFRYIKHVLPRHKIMFAAFVGYAFSNSISMAPSMAARYRLYSYWGLNSAEVTKVFFFHYLSTWLGFLAVGGTIFLIEPTPISSASFFTFSERRWIGVGLLVLLIGYFVLAEILKKGITVKGITLHPPSTRILVSQVVIATLDWALAGVIPFVLLGGQAHFSYLSFLSVFLLAQILQIVSHVPGGIGIFEGTILLLLKSNMPSSAILASLLVYRAIYTLLPLIVAALALFIFEIIREVKHKETSSDIHVEQR